MRTGSVCYVARHSTTPLGISSRISSTFPVTDVCGVSRKSAILCVVYEFETLDHFASVAFTYAQPQCGTAGLKSLVETVPSKVVLYSNDSRKGHIYVVGCFSTYGGSGP